MATDGCNDDNLLSLTRRVARGDQNLKQLVIGYVELIDENDFVEFVNTFYRNCEFSSIEKVTLESPFHDRLVTSEDYLARNFPRLWLAIAKLPHLRYVQFPHQQHDTITRTNHGAGGVMFHAEFLLSFQYPASLTDVSMTHPMRIHPHRLQEIAKVFKKMVNLQRLELPRLAYCGSGEVQEALSPIMSELMSLSRLTHLSLGVINFTENSLLTNNDLCRIFQSPSLESVSLLNLGLGDDEFVIIARQLSKNEALRKLQVRGGHHLSTLGYESILDAMKNQLVILHLDVDDPYFDGKLLRRGRDLEEYFKPGWNVASHGKEVLRAKIESIVRLNRAGRRDLIMNADSSKPSEWVRLLSEVSLDIDAIFELIRFHPMLCNRSVMQ